MQLARRQAYFKKMEAMRDQIYKNMPTPADEKEDTENLTNIGSQMFKSIYIHQASKAHIEPESDCPTDLNDVLRAQRASDIDLDRSVEGNVNNSQMSYRILRALHPQFEHGGSPNKNLDRKFGLARARLGSEVIENLMASEADTIMFSDIGNMELNASHMFKGKSQLWYATATADEGAITMQDESAATDNNDF